MRQGQGRGTEQKEKHFAEAVSLSLQGRRPGICLHLDMNAGCGINKSFGCLGSPLIYVRKAREMGADFRAYFCDNDRQAVSGLEEALWIERLLASEEGNLLGQTVTWCCDNSFALEKFATRISTFQKSNSVFGSIFSDPNGQSKNAFPFDAIAEFANKFPSFDIIMNLNVTNLSWCVKMAASPSKYGHRHVRRCAASMRSLPKNRLAIEEKIDRKQWIVFDPVRSSNFEYVLVMGTNQKKAKNNLLSRNSGLYLHQWQQVNSLQPI